MTSVLQSASSRYASSSLVSRSSLKTVEVEADALEKNFTTTLTAPRLVSEEGTVSAASVSYASIPKTFSATTNFVLTPADKVGKPSVPSSALSPLSPYSRVAASGCPTKYSVTSYGAKGNGVTNDGGAIKRAASAKSALYFPLLSGKASTTYRVGSSMTLSKPIMMPCGVKISVDKGKTLTITAQPKITCMSKAIFTGSGTVLFRGGAHEVHPEWWGATGDDDSKAVQKAADSCRGNACTVMLTQAVGLTATISLKGNAGVYSSAGATVYPVGRSTTNTSPLTAFMLKSGTYARPIHLTDVIAFKYAMRVKGGVRNAVVNVGTMTYGLAAIALAPDAGSTINNFKAQLGACAYYTSCVEIAGVDAGSAGALKNAVVRVNFATTLYGAAVKITKTKPPTFSSSGVIFQAVDPAGARAGFSTLLNASKGKTSNMVLGVDTWAGGYSSTSDAYDSLSSGQLIKGSFQSLVSSFALASTTSMLSNNLWSISGSSNIASIPYLASAGQIYATNQASSISNYPVFYTSITTSSSWAPGKTRTYSIYTPMARWMPNSSLSFVPFREYNGWLVCTKIVNNNSVTKNQVKITLKNVSKSYVTTPYTLRFGLQAGY